MEKALAEMEKPPRLAVNSLTRSEVHGILGLSKDSRSTEIWKLDEAYIIPVPPKVCKYYLSRYPCEADFELMTQDLQSVRKRKRRLVTIVVSYYSRYSLEDSNEN
jgi:hypothetical protein